MKIWIKNLLKKCSKPTENNFDLTFHVIYYITFFNSTVMVHYSVGGSQYFSTLEKLSNRNKFQIHILTFSIVAILLNYMCLKYCCLSRVVQFIIICFICTWKFIGPFWRCFIIYPSNIHVSFSFMVII